MGPTVSKKNKKFYFSDPLLFWIAQKLSGKKIPANTSKMLAESVAHEALSRQHQRFGYLNTPKGEIDFILPGEWALEVKWSSIPTNLSEAYKRLPLLNKRVWSQGNFLKEWP